MKRTFDPLLSGAAALLTLMGFVAIWDAGYARAAEKGMLLPRELISQLIASGVAVAVYFAMRRMPAGLWPRIGWAAYAVALAGLLLVKVMGSTSGGAQRWLDLGVVSVQPAEFAKLGMIVFLAGALASAKPLPTPTKIRDWADALDRKYIPRLAGLIPLFLVLAVVILIEREPDLDTAVVIALSALAMLAAGGVGPRLFWSIMALGLLGGGVMAVAEPYRLQRILTHTDRWAPENIAGSGYQATIAEAAMARGGWFGVGLGEGQAKHILPAPTTDYILATVGEEFGMVGVWVVVGLIGVVVWRLTNLAVRSDSPFVKLLCVGAATWIGVQTCINVMMANGTIPPMGIPLPFLSYGGSSLVALWMTLGIVRSASAEPAPAPEPAPAKSAKKPKVGRPAKVYWS